ncbi:TetR/AcrR family transcriptional regulator [Dactylosporangium darangshiense]
MPAKAAGVGRATLYRRYPDPATVAVALLDEHERDLQQRLLSGPPPLGPGAPPLQRLVAFYAAMVALLEQHLPLAETGSARFAVGAYGFWRAHVRHLLDTAGIASSDGIVDVLLAPLAPELYRYQRFERHQSVDEIAEGLAWLARRVLAPDAG